MLKAIYRFIIVHVLYLWTKRKYYSEDSVTPGYIGWIELPGYGCLAFITEKGDYQYRW